MQLVFTTYRRKPTTAATFALYKDYSVDDDQLLRYSRHIMLPEIDFEGQEKLLDSHVAIVGIGGLGCPVAQYLVASGVGHITLIDSDKVELSNLQRQILHTETNLGTTKVSSARETLQRLNSTTQISVIDQRMTDSNTKLLKDVDVIVDGCDNSTTRFAINEASLQYEIPLVSGAAIQTEGQVVVFDPRVANSPCYRCLYTDEAQESLNCAENGILSPMVGLIGVFQAIETVKLLCSLGESSVGWLFYIDMYRTEWRKLKLPKNAQCHSCSKYSLRSQK